MGTTFVLLNKQQVYLNHESAWLTFRSFLFNFSWDIRFVHSSILLVFSYFLLAECKNTPLKMAMNWMNSLPLHMQSPFTTIFTLHLMQHNFCIWYSEPQNKHKIKYHVTKYNIILIIRRVGLTLWIWCYTSGLQCSYYTTATPRRM